MAITPRIAQDSRHQNNQLFKLPQEVLLTPTPTQSSKQSHWLTCRQTIQERDTVRYAQNIQLKHASDVSQHFYLLDNTLYNMFQAQVLW